MIYNFKQFKKAGFFKELNDYNRPSMLDYINKASYSNLNRIITYLTSGVLIVESQAMAFDVIKPNPSQEVCKMGICTDGTWFWKNEIHYYVKNYNLKLPDSFIQHMEKNNWIIPNPFNRNDIKYDPDHKDILELSILVGTDLFVTIEEVYE